MSVRAKPVSIESLESREHLAVDLKIDFQPASASTPSGYLADVGKVYGTRGSGHSYGWNSSNESQHFDRNSSRSPDQRYDTIAKMSSSKSWALKVPNGWYDVSIYVGDAANHDAKYKINAESKLAVFAEMHYSEKYFGEGHIKVYVGDGKLSLTSASGAENNALAFIHVRSTSAPASTAYSNNLKWSTSGPNSPISRVESGIVQVGTKLYFMGGYSSNDYKSVTNRVDILDIKTNTWSKGAPLPGSQTHAGAATDGRYIYWVSGQKGPLFARGGTSESWRYDTQNKTWSKYVSLPGIRFGGALAYDSGYLYFVGGTGSDRNTASTAAWKLNTKSADPKWTAIASLPRASDHVGHAVLNGKIYIFGGEHDHGNSYVQHNDVYAYTISSNSWSKKANMPTASSHFEGNVVVHNNKIWIFGGQIDAQQLTSEVRSYDPATNKWTRHTSMPEKRKGGASWYNNGRFYYLTGDASGKGQPRYTLSGLLI